jgi:hypothetical protein
MTRFLVGTAMLAVAPSLAPISTASAAMPQPVTMTIVESKAVDGASSGVFTGSGSAFGSGVSGTTSTTSFSPNPGPCFDSPDQTRCLGVPIFTFTASILVSTNDGTFTIALQGSIHFVSFVDPVETLALSGTWMVNGGTGAYATIHGTGTFDELETINIDTNTANLNDAFIGQLQTHP